MENLKIAYEYINNLINIEIRNSISENELSRLGSIKDIVLAILKAEFEAKYEEPWDAHFCGNWYFKNPNYIPETAYRLTYSFYGQENFSNFFVCKNFDNCIKEIHRLDKVIHQAKMVDNLQKEYWVFLGENRIWEITKDIIYVKPVIEKGE